MDALTAPSAWGLFRESLGVLEPPRLLLNASNSAAQPKGTGQPVVVLPGCGAGDGSNAVLRVHLRYVGYNARGWGLGPTRGMFRR
jgi:hypothetical protein